jgi:hypothetical protein
VLSVLKKYRERLDRIKNVRQFDHGIEIGKFELKWIKDSSQEVQSGKKFRNAHSHSIVKKKKVRDVAVNKIYEPIISNFSLQFINRTLVNEGLE